LDTGLTVQESLPDSDTHTTVKSRRSSGGKSKTAATVALSGNSLQKINKESTKAENAKRSRKRKRGGSGRGEPEGSGSSGGTGADIPGLILTDPADELIPGAGAGPGLVDAGGGFNPPGLLDGIGADSADLLSGGIALPLGAGGSGAELIPPGIQQLGSGAGSGLAPDTGFSAPAGGDSDPAGPILQNPEPAGLTLFGIGLAAMGLLSYGRKGVQASNASATS
jgi:hypothetical protein